MACPYFYPVERFEDGAWLKPPRLPLGDPCRGACHAATGTAELSLDELRAFCNVGYARGNCTRFPADAEADAIRFSIAEDHGGIVDVIYIFEREYGPLRHGLARCSAEPSEISDAPDDPILRAQLQRFLESYLRRRTRA